jgi:hypothetical protein
MFEYADISLTGEYREPLLRLARMQRARRRFYALIALVLLCCALMIIIPLALYIALSLALIVTVVLLAPVVWLIVVAMRYQVVTRPILKRRLSFTVGEKLVWQGTRALEIVGIDEDPAHRAFVLDDGSGEMLFLHGECVREALEQQRFPAESIEVVWGPQRKFFVGLFSQGSTLEYSSIHYGELDTVGIWLPKSGECIEGSIDTFAVDFKRHIDG